MIQPGPIDTRMSVLQMRGLMVPMKRKCQRGRRGRIKWRFTDCNGWLCQGLGGFLCSSSLGYQLGGRVEVGGGRVKKKKDLLI